MCSSRRGLLLVEALLSAVVIAVGLVFISRGLSGHLKALRTLEERDTLLALTRSQLLQLESERFFGQRGDSAGDFEAPVAGYRWALAATPRADLTDQAGAPLATEVILTVERSGPPASALRLQSVWPLDWVQQ